MRIRANGGIHLGGGGSPDTRAAEDGIALPAIVQKVLEKMGQ